MCGGTFASWREGRALYRRPNAALLHPPKFATDTRLGLPDGLAKVEPVEDGGTPFTWITDLRPYKVAPRTSELMDLGVQAIKRIARSPGQGPIPPPDRFLQCSHV